MSFGLGHGRTLDDAPGVIGISAQELPPLPDEALTDREAGRIDPRGWFGNPAASFEVEIGCGKGSFMLSEAAARPATNFLGIEWAREFYLYAADRIRRRGLGNVRMLRTDATEFLRWRCPSSIVRVIHLYYSDPWPKSKHHKNRVVQDTFLADCWRCLEPGGELRLVTDHLDLWAWYQAFAAEWTTPHGRGAAILKLGAAPFSGLDFKPPDWVDDEEVIGTNYERKTRAAGRMPNSLVLRKA